VAEPCARRGAGFSRFLQLVPGEGESQATGKLCVLHFLYKGQLRIASLCNRRTKRKWGAIRSLESGDRIELFYGDFLEATIRATVNRLLSDRDEGIRMASVLSGLLLLSFAIGIVTGLGTKTPFDYSGFSVAAAAFLLAFWEPDRFTLDKLLKRLRN